MIFLVQLEIPDEVEDHFEFIFLDEFENGFVLQKLLESFTSIEFNFFLTVKVKLNVKVIWEIVNVVNLE